MMRDSIEDIYETTLLVEKSLYPAQVVLKASYAFIDSCYVHIGDEGSTWAVHLSSKDGGADSRQLRGDFENELISQAIRLSIYQRTHGIREMLLARAMSSSLVIEGGFEHQIEPDEKQDISGEELEMILRDWFEVKEQHD